MERLDNRNQTSDYQTNMFEYHRFESDYQTNMFEYRCFESNYQVTFILQHFAMFSHVLLQKP